MNEEVTTRRCALLLDLSGSHIAGKHVIFGGGGRGGGSRRLCPPRARQLEARVLSRDEEREGVDGFTTDDQAFLSRLAETDYLLEMNGLVSAATGVNPARVSKRRALAQLL